MDTFRKRILSWAYNKPQTLETTVIDAIRNLEVLLLTGNEFHPQSARDIVNIMRNEPHLFSDWANFNTAKLFSPELFIKKVLGRLLVLGKSCIFAMRLVNNILKAHVMKKVLFVFLLSLVFNYAKAQVGIANTALSLEDNSLVGALWEPTATVNYTENSGQGIYGLVIAMRTSDNYLDISTGNKVSIEFTDSTREVLDIKDVAQKYSNTVSNYRIIDIYQTNILVYPNYSNLTNKQLNRIVIQRNSGNVWIINTKPKRAKKLIKEFTKAMQEAVSNYKIKVSNNNYFN